MYSVEKVVQQVFLMHVVGPTPANHLLFGIIPDIDCLRT